MFGLGLYIYAGISIHAPLAGCDQVKSEDVNEIHNFNPRTPRGVRRRELNNGSIRYKISIHAPLAGCNNTKECRNPKREISIHAPLAGCDAGLQNAHHYPNPFQSTHPLRGATIA